MHRSGTSALTGVLTLLGAAKPKTQMAAHAHNPHGFFESVAIMELDNAILRANGSQWNDWRSFHLSEAEVGATEARIAECLQQEFGEAALIAVKDPRICRMAPPWFSAVRKAGYQPLILMPYRHRWRWRNR